MSEENYRGTRMFSFSYGHYLVSFSLHFCAIFIKIFKIVIFIFKYFRTRENTWGGTNALDPVSCLYLEGFSVHLCVIFIPRYFYLRGVIQGQGRVAQLVRAVAF